MSSKKSKSKTATHNVKPSEIQREFEAQQKLEEELAKQLEGKEYLIIDSQTVLVIDKRTEFSDGSVLDY